jgi:tyrosyl-tRNA synthetase
MLYGLKAGQEKMSKSDPDSAIFMEDSAEDVERKINAAYCPRTSTSTSTSTAQTPTNPDADADTDDDAGKESMHLVEDDLKNPCLDYIENIIFCPPDSTFTANNKTYTKFANVKADFVSSALSESDLKASLIVALNLLLDPVRTHFATGRPQELLEKVREYKKMDVPINRQFRRLDAVNEGVVPANSHLVFLPNPNSNPSLGLAIDVLNQLQAAPQTATGGPVLFLSDWGATVQNACHSDAKGVAAAFALLIGMLKTIAPTFMDTVKIVKQVSERSEAKRASLEEDENTLDESPEIATDNMK